MFGITKRDIYPIAKIAQELNPETDFNKMSDWGILFLICGALARQAEKSVIQNLVSPEESDTNKINELNAIRFSQLIEEWASDKISQIIVKKRIGDHVTTEIELTSLESEISYLSMAFMLNSFTESIVVNEIKDGLNDSEVNWQLMFFIAGFLLSEKIESEWKLWKSFILKLYGASKPDLRQLFENYASPRYLRNAIRTLSRIQRKFQSQFSADSLLADIALSGFTFDVLDSALAVETLAETEFPHRAYPIARTAFESAQNAMVLSTQENYVLNGTRAWIYFRRKDSEWLNKARPEGSGVNSQEDAENWLRDRLTEISVMWEKVSPGKQELICEAKKLVEKRNRNAQNWLDQKMEKAQQIAYIKIGELLGQSVLGDSIEINTCIYSRLSEESHAKPRLEPAYFHLRENNLVDVIFSSRDIEQASRSASLSTALSVQEASISLAYRIEVQSRK